jgi:hypothetical protein
MGREVGVKSAEQWVEEMLADRPRTQPAGMINLVRKIQADALNEAIAICVKHAEAGGVQAFRTAHRCANLIALEAIQ